MRCRLLPASLICIALFAGCGDDSEPAGGSNSAATESSSGSKDPTNPSGCPDVTEQTLPDVSFPDGKPAVEIPGALPTELVITDLIEGTGDGAKAGDVVTVNYVGVLSADGTEFDNSYDRGETFPVTLGLGGVIPGWEQGLIGIKSGGRRQLDIPAALAYADRGSGDIIKPGDPLTFIIDAVSVVAGPPIANPADAPVVDIPKSVGATAAVVTQLVEGDQCQIAKAGQTAYIQVILYRGDTGEELQSSWTTGEAIELPLEKGINLQGLIDGIVGMGVGGRRLLIVPPTLGFGAERNVEMGLAADTDVVFLVDLVQLSSP